MSTCMTLQLTSTTACSVHSTGIYAALNTGYTDEVGTCYVEVALCYIKSAAVMVCEIGCKCRERNIPGGTWSPDGNADVFGRRQWDVHIPLVICL